MPSDDTPYVVGVDLSLTATGVAVITPDGKRVVVHTLGTPPDDRTVPSFSGRMDRLAGMIANTVLFPGSMQWGIEGLSFASKSSDLDKIHASWWMIQERLIFRHGWPEPYVVTPTQRAQYATGKGNAAKQAVLLATVRRYPGVDIQDDNQADATLIAHMVRRTLGKPLDTVPALNLKSMGAVKKP